MKTTIYSTMADDMRLADIFHEAERKRHWLWQVDWWIVLAWIGSICWSAVVFTLLLVLGKHLWRML